MTSFIINAKIIISVFADNVNYKKRFTMSLTKEDITKAKGRGFLQNRGTECFSGRAVSVAGIFSPAQLRALAECAERYGSGNVIFTSRLSAEIPGIPFDMIDEADEYIKSQGLSFGGTGAKIRPITACKGTTCIYGNIDTHAIAKTVHERFYIGMRHVALPHKFKIGIGGCPNSCMKPSLNDIGIEGCRKESESRCRIFVGGTWGKKQRIGTLLSDTYPPEEIPDIIEKVMLWYKENAYAKERLGAAIDRLGVEALEDALKNGRLLERREEIIAADILQR